MFLKYNISNKINEKRFLKIKSCSIKYTNDVSVLTFETETPHLLKNSDSIFLERKIQKVEKYSNLLDLKTSTNCIFYVEKDDIINEQDVMGRDIKVEYPSGYYVKNSNDIISLINTNELDKYLSKYQSTNDNLLVQIDEKNNCIFYVTLNKYHNINITLTHDLNDYSIFKFSGDIPVLLTNDDSITLYKEVYAYTFYGVGVSTNGEYKIVGENPAGKTTYLGSDYLKFGNSLYKWELSYQGINCKYVNENTFIYENDYLFENEKLFILDERFFYKTIDDYENITMHLYDDVQIYEQNNYLNITLPVTNNSDIGLNDESTLALYFDERKTTLTSNNNDYEKRCFTPYGKITLLDKLNENNTLLYELNRINFNVFLRDRSDDEGWNTNDAKGWNQYKMNDKGEFEKPGENITKGDLVSVLGFTDDDIYYRKKKVEKTFIRLSFYDSNDPFKQMLIFYSTIFLDSGDLYLKYISNIQKNESDKPIVEQGGFGDNNLTISFNTMDRFNHNKSSEGFYLYLFPDGIKNGEERTIYLKVEFNNAFNGKTVPLIYSDKDFNDGGFPTSLIDENGDISKLYEYMFIPIVVKFDTTKNEYIYYFKNIKLDSDNGDYIEEITINLYEPKINSLE